MNGDVSRSASVESYPDLLATISDQIQKGEPVDLADLTSRYPQFAAQLEQIVPAMSALAMFADSDQFPNSEIPSKELGDFRIIREIGRGGMGIVYEAEQLSLGRQVAVKVLPLAGTFSANQLQRFKNEAKAAASLYHSNIVSAFFVGQERGVHFYAMRLVYGESLADILSTLRQNATQDGYGESQINELCDETTPVAALSTSHSRDARSFFQSIARLGIQATQALHHAHKMGIVHRDIKPSNLLIDQDCHLWVTDFGLASIQADESFTLTGDFLGTLRYMSPEQAAGESNADVRSDIYSLGVTLFELLTLQPATQGSSRAEMMQQLQGPEPPSVCAIDSRIPRDLGNIVNKAISKTPADRYDSMLDFGEDLRRFLDGRPIVARRITSFEKGRRWARRNRSLSSALLILSAILLALAIGGPIAAFRYAALARAEHEAVLAQRWTENELLNLLDVTLTETVVSLENAPYIDATHENLLTDTVQRYMRLLRQNEHNPSLRYRVGCDLIRLGRVANLRFKIKTPELAKESYARGVDLLEDLLRSDPENVDYRTDLAFAYLFYSPGSLDQRRDILRKSIEMYEEVRPSSPSRGTNGLAEAKARLATNYRSARQYHEAEREVRQSLDLYNQLLSENPENADVVAQTAWTRLILGGVLMESARLAEAEAEFRKALAAFERIERYVQSKTRYRIAFGSCQRALSATLFRMRRSHEAEPLIDAAVDGLRSTTQGFPDSRFAKRNLMRARFTQAEILIDSNRFQEAMIALRESLTLAGQLEIDDGLMRYRLAQLQWRSGNERIASETFREVLASQEPEVIALIRSSCPDQSLRDPLVSLKAARLACEQPAYESTRVLALSLFRAGQFDAARRELESRTSKQHDALNYFLLSICQHKMGKQELAKQSFELGELHLNSPLPGRLIHPAWLDEIQAEAASQLGIEQKQHADQQQE